MKVTVEITGLRELRETLTRSLPAKVQRKAVASALRNAAQPMVKAAKASYRALGGSGSLAVATGVWRNRKAERKGSALTFASIEVGPRRSNRRALATYYAHYRGRTPTPHQLSLGIRHGHLVEWGTTHSAARRIMTRVFDTHARAAVERFGGELARAIEKEAERRGRLTAR